MSDAPRDASSDIVIALESPRQRDVAALVEELDRYLAPLYPPESNHLLDIDALAAADVRFFVARLRGVAVGCGAVRIDGVDSGEVKRIFVAPSARGLRVGQRLLNAIESHARRERLAYLRLETGIRQPEALALFRRAGFTERGPFGQYRPDPLSVFMEKPLAPQP